ncbi:MAG: hypothetical protein SNJ52_04350, partial [Verrucomicrobiia bacterium]
LAGAGDFEALGDRLARLVSGKGLRHKRRLLTRSCAKINPKRKFLSFSFFSSKFPTPRSRRERLDSSVGRAED